MRCMKSSGRIMGVDLGARRVGVALTDPSRTLATPRGALTGPASRVAVEIVRIARDEDVTTIVVGRPRRTDGREELPDWFINAAAALEDALV